MIATSSGHRFSPMDARRTVVHALDFIDGFAASHRGALTERRAQLAELTSGATMDTHDDAIAAILDEVWRLLTEARHDLDGRLPAGASGSVVGLFAGSGGVPKGSVQRVDVDLGGVVGDRQATRRHHGAPFQALCLWSAEVIDSLASTGHPIAPGAAGENVTIAGLDWASVTPGVRLSIGSVVCDVSSSAVPCSQNARWFSDGRFDRIHHRHGPISRMYATVVAPGEVEVGDEVVLEPT